MQAWTELTDELGPERIMYVYDPKVGMKGIVVVDTTLQGRAAGGTRMMPDITSKEMTGLARAMTHKFSILDIPIGGSKAGILADPGMKREPREAILKSFGHAIMPLLKNEISIGADIGTNTEDVRMIYEGAGLLSGGSGLSEQEKDGEPLENHATGYGVVVAARAACEFAGLDIDGATVALEGFGKVGGGVARYITEAGTRVVAVSNIHGAIYDQDGLDVKKLLQMRKEFGDNALQAYEGGRHIERVEIYSLPVDILVPGARPYVIDERNVDQVQAKIISSIANIPITDKAEEKLFQRGIHSIPDFIANAGGVILGVIDAMGGTVDDVFKALRDRLGPLTHEILAEAQQEGINPRKLASSRSREKVLKARTEEEKALSIEEMFQQTREKLRI